MSQLINKLLSVMLATSFLVATSSVEAVDAFSVLTVPPGPAMPKMRSICGSEDWQDVEQYDGSLGPFSTSVEFVARHQGAVGNLKWNDDFRSGFTNPGDIPCPSGNGA